MRYGVSIVLLLTSSCKSFSDMPSNFQSGSLEENGSAATLVAKRSAGATPEVNLRECVTCTLPPSMNKDISRPQKGLMSSNFSNFKKAMFAVM